jgi:hypothetical protein
MIRVMSFVSLTDEGIRSIATFRDVVAKVRERSRRTAGSCAARSGRDRRGPESRSRG